MEKNSASTKNSQSAAAAQKTSSSTPEQVIRDATSQVDEISFSMKEEVPTQTQRPQSEATQTSAAPALTSNSGFWKFPSILSWDFEIN